MEPNSDTVQSSDTATASGTIIDELLAELREHRGGLTRSRDRLHDLLQEILGIVEADLDLDTILRQIVESAVRLVSARYGALGVLDESGQFAQFIPVGVNEETVSKMGPYPHGHGVLGLVTRDPRPLRLAEISKHPASCGFPPHHPPMRTFLGVPIRTRGAVFANLYLTDKQGGAEFDAEDEAVIATLAAAVGVAVDDARLYDESLRRERWLQALTEITRSFLAGTEPPQMLAAIVQQARELCGADTAFVALPPHGSQDLVIEAADGTDADRFSGVALPLGASLAGHVFQTGEAVVLTDLRNDDRAVYPIADSDVGGPTLYVPVGRPGALHGVLAVLNKPAGATFGPTVQHMLGAFVDQATVALELARRRIEAERLTVLEERDRIARDLHDLVIQRLYVTGMSLSGVTGFAEAPEVHHRVTRAVDDLDETISEIRTAIFGLQSRPQGMASSLRAALLREVNDAITALGFAPSLRLDGPLDTTVPGFIGRHLPIVLREALSNIAQHAGASHVEVTVATDTKQVSLAVVDDGVGVTDAGAGNGLRNLEERAVELGGSLHISAVADGGGTRLQWLAPLAPSPARE